MIAPIEDAAARQHRIKEACQHSQGEHWVTLREGPVQIPTVHLDQELLVYRVDNGRLLAALQEHFKNQPSGLKQLHRSESAASTQDLLHALLLVKAGDQRGPILRELKRLKVQTEPLLVDSTGVVVNGNRRLSAMRQLQKEDPERFHRFQKPLVAVLPDEISRSDVEYIETALQLAPETKLPYGWVDRRLKLRRQIDDLGLDPDWVQEAYRLDSRQQLDDELAELALVERYLSEICGTPFAYSAVVSCERLFQSLQRQLRLLPTTLANAWTAIGLLLINQRSKLSPAFDRQFPFEVPVTEAMPEIVLQRLANDPGLLAHPLHKPLRRKHIKRMTERILHHQTPAELARTVETVIDEVRQQLRQDRVPHRLLHHLHASKRLLEKLTPDQLTDAERFNLLTEANTIRGRLDLLISEPQHTTQSKSAQRWWRGRRRLSNVMERLLRNRGRTS